jgi:protein arginine kinase
MQALHLLSHFDRTARGMRRGGHENDVVISSRVRLARNFRRWEFPHRAPIGDLMLLRHKVFTALPHVVEEGGAAFGKSLHGAGILPFEEFTPWERQSLVDRHLTSREHIRDEGGRGMVATADSSISLLVNEEDHLRLQSMLPGLQLDAAYNLVDKLDDALEKYFDDRGGLAYSDQFGYLTACPTNAGTGMRASVMLHLPGLEIAGRTERARKIAKDKGFTLRGTFGEGSKIWGNLHQLSNQVTLGLDETEILLEVEALAREICEMERQARRACTRRLLDDARDMVGRSYGTLRYARHLGCREATDRLSMLRLGLELGWVKGLTRQRFNELMVWIRPAYMQVLHGRALHGDERDILRANLLRTHVTRVRLDPVITKEEYSTTDTSIIDEPRDIDFDDLATP